MTHTLRVLVVAIGAVLTAPMAGTMYAQLDEYGVKASFVRNFVAFVEWPAVRLDADAPLVICVFNDSPIAARLSDLKMAPVRDHRVQVRSIGAVPDLDGCHAVFVPLSEIVHVADIQSRYHGAGMLTITDAPRERTGAVINMFVNDSRMAFDVDLDAARSQSVQVSSKLLALAHQVHGATASAQGRPR